jgi:hypothetical protein
VLRNNIGKIKKVFNCQIDLYIIPSQLRQAGKKGGEAMSKLRANERREEIMRILESERVTKMSNLAAQFQVTRQTILTDIEILMASYPIETVRGRYGHVKLQNGYASYKRILSEEQQDVLIEIFPKLDERQARVIRGLLLANGSMRNKERIESCFN